MFQKIKKVIAKEYSRLTGLKYLQKFISVIYFSSNRKRVFQINWIEMQVAYSVNGDCLTQIAKEYSRLTGLKFRIRKFDIKLILPIAKEYSRLTGLK